MYLACDAAREYQTLCTIAGIVTQGRTAMAGSAASEQKGTQAISDIGYTVVEPMH